MAGQQAGDSVLGICAREFLAAENGFCASVAVEAAACTRPDFAVVYWTSARIIMSVRAWSIPKTQKAENKNNKTLVLVLG